MDEEYKRGMSVGQAINLAVEYVLRVKPLDALDTPDKFVSEVEEVVPVMKSMSEKIQRSYANVSNAMNNRVDMPVQPPQVSHTPLVPDEKPCPIPELVCD